MKYQLNTPPLLTAFVKDLPDGALFIIAPADGPVLLLGPKTGDAAYPHDREVTRLATGKHQFQICQDVKVYPVYPDESDTVQLSRRYC